MVSPRRSTTTLLLLLVPALASTISGCGGDDDDPSSAPRTTAATERQDGSGSEVDTEPADEEAATRAPAMPDRGDNAAAEPEEAPIGPGDPAVYERIATTNDCAVLDRLFAEFKEEAGEQQSGSRELEITTTYIRATRERAKALDCL